MPASLSHLLVDEATVHRLVEVSLGSGRFSKDLQPLSTGNRFRSFAAGAREIALGEAMRANVTHTGYCESDLNVETQDEIEITSKEGVAVSGEQYRVVAVLRPSLTHHQKLLMERIARAK